MAPTSTATETVWAENDVLLAPVSGSVLRDVTVPVFRAGSNRILIGLLLAAVPAGQSFTCTPTAVWDGDGPIWCAEGPKVRLAGISAREIDGTCTAGVLSD